MNDKNSCKKCICYICDNNDKCLRCQQCVDNNMFQENEESCDDFKE